MAPRCRVARVTLAGTALAACGTSSAGTGPVTLNYYLYPDTSGATQAAINNCDAQSHGAYKISYQQLPQASDGQRQQMVRRLAAHDGSMDILGLDVTWEPEFAQAGWIVPWTGTNKAQAIAGTLKPALQTATWKGQLVAVPANTNTQLLWYRSDLVPTPPTTWAQMIADAEQLAKEGKPHYIEIQGAQYEGAQPRLAHRGGHHPEGPGRPQVARGRGRQPARGAGPNPGKVGTRRRSDPGQVGGRQVHALSERATRACPRCSGWRTGTSRRRRPSSARAGAPLPGGGAEHRSGRGLGGASNRSAASLTPKGADVKVLARFKEDKSPAVLERTLGKGRIHYVAALPGVAYLWVGLTSARRPRPRPRHALGAHRLR